MAGPAAPVTPSMRVPPRTTRVSPLIAAVIAARESAERDGEALVARELQQILLQLCQRDLGSWRDAGIDSAHRYSQ